MTGDCDVDMMMRAWVGCLWCTALVGGWMARRRRPHTRNQQTQRNSNLVLGRRRIIIMADTVLLMMMSGLCVGETRSEEDRQQQQQHDKPAFRWIDAPTRTRSLAAGTPGAAKGGPADSSHLVRRLPKAPSRPYVAHQRGTRFGAVLMPVGKEGSMLRRRRSDSLCCVQGFPAALA